VTDRVPDPAAETALALIRAIAARVDAAVHLEPPAGEAILRSVVDAAAAVIRAEAASIALYDASIDRLTFRVAAGEQGQGVVGLSIKPGDGVAGYVYASGEPLAIGETTVDPRFRREAAEQTGYVPRSLLAVPLADDEGTIGVLEVLDRRDGSPFDLMDMEAATVFARQATIAIRATGLERTTATLLRDAIRSLAPEVREPDVEALVTAAIRDPEPGTWALADAVAKVRGAAPEQLALVVEILEALARRAGGPSGRFRSARR
jgi:GAF domain-containing protein